jgi:uncharacterized membrane protein YkoI
MALCLMVAATHTLAQTSGISLQDAEHIALQLFPNSSVESVERDVDRGVPVYEVELRDDRGVEHEVIIDAQNGRVIRTHVDD